ncbi:uncharacterized protein LOC135167628 isoform X2 [Diachasmimorpha longicaudata]|uniref:uncharacterized protein LOC135167628 isoform X2 n=1 Tax=Diachasmimorpha longicaudata TaxID=58733 RepID=UPI0030B8B3DC
MDNLYLYKQYVDDLRIYARENGITDEETKTIFDKCFLELEHKYVKRIHILLKGLKILILGCLLVFICSMGLYNHPSTHSIFLRNMQNFIYPGLTVFRQLAVPIIQRYPTLTENPFFKVADMDCWPCTTAQSVPDMTSWNMTNTFNIAMPFTRVESDNKINLNSIISMYEKYSDIFDADAKKVTSNNPHYRIIKNLIENRLDEHPSQSLNTHISWKLNRMRPNRLVRKLMPNPLGIPKWWSQSTERYFFIDEAKADEYVLPNPECSNVILRSTSGSRLIKIMPTPECQRNCKSSVILLSSHHTLWYNWWYWRPTSLPVINSTDISINHLTSFC